MAAVTAVNPTFARWLGWRPTRARRAGTAVDQRAGRRAVGHGGRLFVRNGTRCRSPRTRFPPAGLSSTTPTSNGPSDSRRRRGQLRRHRHRFQRRPDPAVEPQARPDRHLRPRCRPAAHRTGRARQHPCQALPCQMVKDRHGEWRLRDRPWRLAASFTLQAQRPRLRLPPLPTYGLRSIGADLRAGWPSPQGEDSPLIWAACSARRWLASLSSRAVDMP